MASFRKTDPKQNFPALEKDIQAFWKQEGIFQRTIDERPEGKHFTFYDGPPFATGLPHYGHIVGQVMKDMVPRYWTMRGFRVDRRWGWDCHGVPIEMQKEKELHLGSKREIEAYGVDRFNDSCRSTILEYAADWKVLIERLGRFVDMENDYKTMEPWYMESIWWVFKELWKKDLVYLGHKVVPFSYRMGSTLSNFEAQQNYQDRQDPAVTVKFKANGLKGTNDAPVFFLAWTTTPWTLPTNLLLAVGADIDYVMVYDKEEKEQYVLAREALEKVYKYSDDEEVPYEIVAHYKGTELEGILYEPVFPYFASKQSEGAFKVVTADFVATGEGVGIVHLAPYGEDDFAVLSERNISIVDPVQDDGTYTPEVSDFEGQLVFDANKDVISYLKEHGTLVKQETINHSYPHCWRTDTPLLYKPVKSWFVKVTAIKQDLIENNQKINWVPGHVKDGRFGKWLENARDWAVSRSRFWGTPLPIWTNEDMTEFKVIGSLNELYKASKGRLTKVTLMRHGFAEHNEHDVWSSALDTHPLTAKGKTDLTSYAKKHLERPDVIYVSPVLRTQQTAELLKEVFEGQVEIRTDDRLREMAFGEWEEAVVGSKELQTRLRAWKKLKGTDEFFRTPRCEGSESFADIAARTDSLVKEVLENHKGQHVMLLSHGGVLKVLEQQLKQKPTNKIHLITHPSTGRSRDIFIDTYTGSEFDLHKQFVDGISLPSRDGEGVLTRVPDVFDCWFESGSMPYAQNHFPFENEDFTKENFPADFIAEGSDQTRGWFYTLNVLATALSDGKSGLGMYKPAFKNCIVNGIVLAEDGKKMSKRLQNYPDPSVIFEKYGADAMRFYLMNSPVVQLENLRFSERGVEEVVKKLILPLWNSYSFFTTYANVDGWTTDQKNLSNLENSLDRWVLSRLDATKLAYHDAMEAYDLKTATTELLDFMDALTNWYIRRSRRRFWKSQNDGDKMQAYATLHEVLLRYVELLAPVCPFITDYIYQDLTTEAASVHLALLAEETPKWFNAALDQEVGLARLIVKLGHNIRAREKLKVRQPLAKAEVALPEGIDAQILQPQLDVIAEELNVKEIVFVENPESLGSAYAKPDARVLGPRLGREVQRVITEAKAGNFTRLEDGSIKVLDYILAPHEVEVGYHSIEGKAADSEAGVVVALDVELTTLLVQEGIARDMIRVVQDLRKEADLEVQDRIEIVLSGDITKQEQEVLEQFGDMIQQETLAEHITFSGDTPQGKVLEIDGNCITLGVRRLS